MERKALLIARIALYRRYLAEGADGDVARAYLWNIKRDQAELAIIVQGRKDNDRAEGEGSDNGTPPPEGEGISRDG